jgi:excisionase family DNA binding protein
MERQSLQPHQAPVSDPDRPLYVNTVATRLGLSRRTVRHLAKIGSLRATKVGPKLWLFRSGDVDEFKTRREADRV